MNRASNKRLDNILAGVGLLVAFPAMVFFTGSFLKYEMNLLTNVEILVPPPAIMIGGLLLAIFLNLYSLLRSKGVNEYGDHLSSRIKSRPWNVMVLSVAVLFLTLLFGYVLMENLSESTST